ncbi:MAG: hypothetical protein LBK29_02625 [Oscillospiraceae bacterium]|nr:hypothetical protein [Oscillospiraceae bacterium]
MGSKNKYLVFILLLPLFFSSLFFCGCKKNEEQDLGVAPEVSADYDILVYGTEPTFNEPFKKMVEKYRDALGVVVKHESSSEIGLDSRMKSSNPPDIFLIKTMDELEVQKNLGNVLDFLNASENTFKSMCSKIPENLKLGLSEINSCGIPLTTRGFGFVVDPKMIAAIFGEGKYKSVINDLNICSYEEFEEFVKSISKFIEGGKPNPANLRGKSYIFSGIKNGLSSSLESVFAFSAEISVLKAMNSALAASFESASEFACSQEMEKFKIPAENFMQAFDLVSENTRLGRGMSLTDREINSQKQASKQFAAGEAFFLLADDLSFNYIKVYNPEIASRVNYIPFKIPIKQKSIKTNLNENKINSNLTVFCPYYLVINANSEKLKFSQDFLTWLKTSPIAEKCLVEDFEFAPYDSRDVSIISNKLSRSALSFLSSNKIIPPVFWGSPQSWEEKIIKQIDEKYLSKSDWSENDYDVFSNFCLEKWET